MRMLDKLKKEATESCDWRRHNLSAWTHFNCDRSASAECINKNCSASVCVHTEPMPNDIDIGGSAVAMTCPFIYKDPFFRGVRRLR